MIQHYRDLASTKEEMKTFKFEQLSEDKVYQKFCYHELFTDLINGLPKDVIRIAQLVPSFESLIDLYRFLKCQPSSEIRNEE